MNSTGIFLEGLKAELELLIFPKLSVSVVST
jgi:hypothetical protein